MKTIFAILICSWTFGMSAQNFDRIGADDKPYLNEDEVMLLNSLLEENRDDFDFKDKKVAFVTGSLGRRVAAKSDYFKSSVLPWVEEGSRPQISMVQLTRKEKEQSGGYDVLVLSWVKSFSRRAQKGVIEELGQKYK